MIIIVSCSKLEMKVKKLNKTEIILICLAVIFSIAIAFNWNNFKNGVKKGLRIFNFTEKVDK